MMDISSMRVWATVLLVALSVAVWRWLASATPASGAADRKKAKKRAKKRNGAKKNTPATAAADESVIAEQASNKLTATAATKAGDRRPVRHNEDNAAAAIIGGFSEGVSESDDSDDPDYGLSAAQVLTRRRFKTRAVLGGGKTSAATASTVEAPLFHVHQRVLARYQRGRDWFPGVIIEVRRGKEYHVHYDDGAVEHRVPQSLIQAEPVNAGQATGEPTGTTTGHVQLSPAVDSGRSEADDEAETSVNENDAESSEDDGWHVVGSTRAVRRTIGSSSASAPAVVGDGLTKRQRENRRKKERQRETKELARAQAQEHGLHARWGGTASKMKYVPPPPPPST